MWPELPAAIRELEKHLRSTEIPILIAPAGTFLLGPDSRILREVRSTNWALLYPPYLFAGFMSGRYSRVRSIKPSARSTRSEIESNPALTTPLRLRNGKSIAGP